MRLFLLVCGVSFFLLLFIVFIFIDFRFVFVFAGWSVYEFGGFGLFCFEDIIKVVLKIFSSFGQFVVV